MVGIEEFSRAVSHVHLAAGAPDMWATAFADIAACLDASACSIAIDGDAGREILATTISPEAESTYKDYYHALDFITDACTSGPAGVVRTGYDLVADNKRTEFHNDWQRRFCMTDGLFVRLSATTSTSFVVSAPSRDDPFANPERVEFVKALVPHLRHALHTRASLRNTDLHDMDVSTAADVTRHGVVVVADGGRIVRMNSPAERIFQSQDGLSVRGATIEALLPSANAELHAAIANAVSGQRPESRVGAYLICGRLSAQRPLILRVVPLDDHDDVHRATAAIVIIDPELAVAPPIVLLRKLFDLSRAEVEVALRLLRGEGLQAIADELTVSVATVKSHVQRIFHKTATHRQAELVRLLLAVSL